MKKSEGAQKNNKNAFKHGHTKTGWCSPTYMSWIGMRQRCQNSCVAKFPIYGGRGISVCLRWQEFVNFLSDMGERPVGMTLDRKNSNGNYEPENCRWATSHMQRMNRRPQ